jgi:predicted DNA-binding ArsR family transcriptional regulator
MLIGLTEVQNVILIDRLQELILVLMCPKEEIDSVFVEEVIKMVVGGRVIVAIRSHTVNGYMPRSNDPGNLVSIFHRFL